MKISIIIVNYNVKYFLEQALHSVRKAVEGIQAEVFVVDNNSADGSCEMVKRKFPEVILIENKHNPGFSKANNQAIQQAKGEYVLLLNPDTVVEEDCFAKVCNFMDATPDAGALGVKMIDGKGVFLPESKRGLPTPEVAFYKMFGLSALFPKSKRFGRYHLGYLSNDEVHSVDVLSGAFMLLRKSVIDQIGMLDEDYFMYGEDIDLSYRITQAGFKNYYFPDTTIIHYKGESTKKASVNYVFVFYRAMIIFAQKHYSQKNARMFSGLINTAIYGRAFIAILFRLVQSTYVWLLDILLFVIGTRFIADSYANYKYASVEAYAPSIVNLNSWVYALLWSGGLFVVGAYQKRTKPSTIVKGILLGTVAVAVFYAFASEGYRFSRAIIVLGILMAIVSSYLLRVLMYAITHKKISLGLSSAAKTIIVGNLQEASRVQQLLANSHATSEYIGYVSVKDEAEKNEYYLGSENQLAEVVELFKVDEIIFCSRDLSTQNIMQWMYTISKPDVHFKIVPEESMFIIGSNSKDTTGDFYTFEINLALNTPALLRQKRALDIVVSVFGFLLLPLLIWMVDNKTNLVLNLFKVLLGEKTWVGYSAASNLNMLPNLKPGVLSPQDAKPHTTDDHLLQKMNLQYAKEYAIDKDLTIILKCIPDLGR